MKKIILLLIILPIAVSLYSEEKADSLKSWKVGGLASFNLSQVSLTNWSAGGKSSTSGIAMFSIFGNYKKDKTTWENSLNVEYGLLKEDEKALEKSNDKIDLVSKYGIVKSERISITTLFNFKTQFAPGYKSPNKVDAISRFMAPGYMTLSEGIDYHPSKTFSMVISPLTGKMTFVLDDKLSATGNFGVSAGDKTRYEVGSFVKMEWKTDLMKNVGLQTKVDFFSNYLHNPENIDVNWDLLLNMKINDFLSANLITSMIYDDDIKIAIDKNNDGIFEAKGPRLQFKELFGLGLSLKF